MTAAVLAYRFHVAGFPPMDIAASKEFGDKFFAGIPDLRHPVGGLPSNTGDQQQRPEGTVL